ncbi:techylectin-5B-like [Asterias amurensis]|uniref:techylectin-5B-like n=1 Tax=Asterias amurensis TaxID=7602 RepID=UPI003AB60B85
MKGRQDTAGRDYIRRVEIQLLSFHSSMHPTSSIQMDHILLKPQTKPIMIIITTALFMTFMAQSCQSETPRQFTGDFYLTENGALLNHVLRWKTVSSPVICGRDCSMDPQCASFNYHIIRGICGLNNASKAQRPDDFVAIQGSAYYDVNLDTLSFSLPGTSSCLELYQAGYRINGLYTIFPTSLTDGLQVYCDMETDGGGWIVFQRRQDGSVDFDRTWADYQSGFGDLQNEFWLGNDILRDLTESGRWRLRVDMEDWESNTAWASYNEFNVTGEKYNVHFGAYDAQGTAGDDPLERLNGYPFTTKDNDNDDRTYNCAERYRGGWWFNGCFWAHLNGYYFPQGEVLANTGIIWSTWKTQFYSLKKCSMKIRQVT